MDDARTPLLLVGFGCLIGALASLADGLLFTASFGLDNGVHKLAFLATYSASGVLPSVLLAGAALATLALREVHAPPVTLRRAVLAAALVHGVLGLTGLVLSWTFGAPAGDVAGGSLHFLAVMPLTGLAVALLQPRSTRATQRPTPSRPEPSEIDEDALDRIWQERVREGPDRE